MMAEDGATQCSDGYRREESEAAEYKRNVRSSFAATFFSQATSAIALGALFDALLLNLGGEQGNALVGAVESTRGLLQLALAYPIGALSDRFSKVRLLKFNAPVWSAGLAICIAAVLAESHVLIFAGIALWAVGSQCWNGTSLVLVVDCTPPRQRTKVVADMQSVRLLANSVGPMLQVALLVCLRQNHWQNDLLKWVISLGCLLWPLVLVWTLCLSDLPPLEKAASQRGLGKDAVFRDEDLDVRVRGIKVRYWIAATLEVVSFITAIGAGMTVKFFPLFFRIDYGFTPVEVCLLSFAYPVCIAGMVQLCRRASKIFGRLHCIVFFHILGTSCLWLMCYVRMLPLVLPLFIVRGALMNARGPVNRAVILDMVASEQRGRWNSIQSITQFTWSGSAALGGFIADRSGDYRFTFAVTAGIYSVAALLYVPLLFIYPRECTAERAQPAPTAPTSRGQESAGGASHMAQQLLAPGAQQPREVAMVAPSSS